MPKVWFKKGMENLREKEMKKIFIQCGYEDRCKNKDCLNCQRKRRHNMNMTLAEECCVEDFAMCDLDCMLNGATLKGGLKVPNKKEDLELMQDIMKKLMMKMFRSEEKVKWEK